MKHVSQGRILIGYLRSKPLTAMEMLKLGVSVCPWKRVVESLRPDEKIVKGKRHLGGRRYLTTWAVRKA